MKQRFQRLPKRTRQVIVGLVGWFVLLVGVVMIPYPGPGWVVVFVGLSILATEFVWAAQIHDYAHGKYDIWQYWYGRQPIYIKSIFWFLTFATAVVTVWLLNGYGTMNDWLNLKSDWLKSPFAR